MLYRTPVITFNHHGYDPFLDFIKAYAIIMVLVGHTIPHQKYLVPNFWIGMQVPLFILVQSFHSLKKDKPVFSIKKAMTRIFVPFIIVEFGVFVFMEFALGMEFNELADDFIKGGGIGPGAYFPWVYIQIAILLPLLRQLFNHGSRWMQALIAIVVCEGLEIFSSTICTPPRNIQITIIQIFISCVPWVVMGEGWHQDKCKYIDAFNT